MKFRLILIFILILSCSPQLSTLNKKQPYTAKGFAFIYNDNDFKEKIINSSMNNDILLFVSDQWNIYENKYSFQLCSKQKKHYQTKSKL